MHAATTPLNSVLGKYNIVGILVLVLIVAVISAIFSILGSNAPAIKKLLWFLFVIIPGLNIIGVIFWFGNARSKWYRTN
jgi:hypothetical protein